MKIKKSIININQARLSLAFLAWFLFFGCGEKGYNQDNSFVTINKDFKQLVKSEIEIRKKTLNDQELYTSELLYKTHSNDSQIYLSDEKFCKLHLISEKLKVKRSFDNSDFPYIEQCFHSFDKTLDTTYLFYSHPFKIGEYVNDSLIDVTTTEKEIHANHFLPARRLANSNYLVPSAENIMKEPSYYKKNFDISNLADYMKNQYLFTILDKKGQVIKEFGKFPEIYIEEGIKYLSPLPYYYSLQGERIFVSFPISNQVFIYGIDGEIQEQFLIDLPGFDFPEKDVNKKSLIPCIDGFSVEQIGDEYVLYFKTFSMVKPGHGFYKINKKEKTITVLKMNQFNNVGLLLPNTYNDQLKFLHISWDEEPIQISTLNF